MGQHEYPIYKIPKYRYQFAIVPGLKILPGELITVFCLRQIGGQHISQHILLIRKILQILMHLEQPSSCWLTFSLLPDS